MLFLEAQQILPALDTERFITNGNRYGVECLWCARFVVCKSYSAKNIVKRLIKSGRHEHERKRINSVTQQSHEHYFAVAQPLQPVS